jgi:hypothetical protein
MGIRNFLIDLLYIFAPEMDPRLGDGQSTAVLIAAAWQEGALVSKVQVVYGCQVLQRSVPEESLVEAQTSM